MLKLPSPYNDNLCGSEQLFNPNSESCEPCTPETNQVRWEDIIDKPECFPSCTPEVVGVTSLNGYTGIITLGIGSTGNDFNIVNSLGTITLNLPVANSTKTGKLSSTDWNIFNGKQDVIALTTIGTSGAATFIGNILNIPQYQAAGTYLTNIIATSPITSSGGTTPIISTSMNTNKLIGRSTAGLGVMEEISIGTGLTLSGGTLSASAQVPGFEQHFLLMGA